MVIRYRVDNKFMNLYNLKNQSNAITYKLLKSNSQTIHSEIPRIIIIPPTIVLYKVCLVICFMLRPISYSLEKMAVLLLHVFLHQNLHV